MESPSLEEAQLLPVTFNVEECSTGTSYKAYIERLRRCFPTTSFSSARRVLETMLRTGSHAIKLRIYHHRLHLQGYKVQGSDQWLELGFAKKGRPVSSDPPGWVRTSNWLPIHMIAGSSFLDLAEYGYSHWQLVIGKGWTMDSITLGQPQLTTAVNLLATSVNRQERAWSLMVVSLMIREGFRFDCISDYVARHAFLGIFTPPPWMLQLVLQKNYWGEWDSGPAFWAGCGHHECHPRQSQLDTTVSPASDRLDDDDVISDSHSQSDFTDLCPDPQCPQEETAKASLVGGGTTADGLAGLDKTVVDAEPEPCGHAGPDIFQSEDDSRDFHSPKGTTRAEIFEVRVERINATSSTNEK